MSINDPRVSVIIPCFNSQQFIEETINSVICQTYENIEILVVDDCSSDSSLEVIEELVSKDPRISLFVQSHNGGVAKARNRGLEHARGRYITYLDADDLWERDKLAKQLEFMKNNKIGACFTSYKTITEDGRFINVVHVPKSVDYRQFLKNTITCSHTVMFDTQIVNKELLVMPDLKRGQDLATWLTVARSGHVFYGLDLVLAKYRKSTGSLSSNKIKAIKRTWNVYRNVEHLSIPYAAWCQLWQMVHAIGKRMRKGQKKS